MKETLFVGDSNTEGISAYGFLPLQYVLVSTGMPIQGVTKTRCIYFYGYDQPVTMATAVGMLKPRRVILSFGTNNAGGTTTKDFIKNYETAIAAIEKSYPHCDIIVESILPVKKNRSYPDIKKEDIDEFNLALAKMCKDKGYMFLNSAEIFKGKDGYAKIKMCIRDSHTVGYACHKILHMSRTNPNADVHILFYDFFKNLGKSFSCPAFNAFHTKYKSFAVYIIFVNIFAEIAQLLCAYRNNNVVRMI